MTGNDLSALIGSRICHDLISPLGAIGNGVELLSMSGQGTSPEFALIAESVENANARIKFFRVAFGSASQGAEIGETEVQGILHDMFRSGRTQVRWDVQGPSPRVDVKLAFLLIQCLENALPWGGTITANKTGQNWRLVAKGEKLKIEQELWQILNNRGRPGQVVAADVHFALVPAAAKTAARSVAVHLGEDQITLSF